MEFSKNRSQPLLTCAFVMLAIGFLPSALLANQVILPFGSVWNYLDDGSDQGTAWVQPGFDDRTWASGPAQLGYGERDEATVVGFGGVGSNRYPTTYFRRTFTITDLKTFPGLRISLLRDDGAIVYINGSEVHRSNMPAGEISYLDFTTGPLGRAEKIPDVFTVLPEVLVAGKNWIAVEVHQERPGSSDLSFDLKATDGFYNAPPVLETALLVIHADGGTSLHLSASDCDTESDGLLFDFSGVGSGRFELKTAPGIPISSATQGQFATGLVTFVPLAQSFSSANIAGKLAEPARHDEISGLVASIKNPGILWASEDGDNPETLIALGSDASNRGEWTLTGVTNTDWEDIAAAEVEGQAMLYIGDFGDNNANRASLSILRVQEPLVTGTSGGSIPITDIEAINFQYPATPAGESGAAGRDAESMIVDPHTGDLYILTKREVVGRLFRLAHQMSYTGIQTLEYLGDLPAITHDTVYGFSVSSTAADISRDGLEVLVRNYGHVQLFSRPDLGTSIAAMLTGSKIEDQPFVGIAQERLGEAICFSAGGDGYYTVSERSAARADLPLFFYPRIPPGSPPKFSVTASDGALSDGPYSGTVLFDPSPKNTWRHLFFDTADLDNPALEQSRWGDLADPDADGRVNLMEYALGTNPLKLETPDGLEVISSPAYLIMIYEIDTSKTDIDLRGQTSSDLRNWIDVPSEVLASTNGIETRRVTIPLDDSSPGYLRLKVSAPDPE